MAQSLSLCIVRILDANAVPVGVGFLIGDGLILTCAHVVASALGLKGCPQVMPEIDIKLDFPLLEPGQVIIARVVFWVAPLNNGKGDIAGLHISENKPAEARSVNLVKKEELWGHNIRAFGFPDGYDMGVWVDGELRDLNAFGWLQVIDTKKTGYPIGLGFSGGPVWDEELEGVVGMLVAADQPEIRAAYVLPTTYLIKVWPILSKRIVSPCPYRGLSAFRRQDAPIYFGRESFVERLYVAVQRRALIAVIGPSGSGKSSVVFAGLIPEILANLKWLIADFRPGKRPVESLSAALVPLLEPDMTETDHLVEIQKLSRLLMNKEIRLSKVIQRILKKHHINHLLLVIDQFEELYPPYPDEGVQSGFVNLLLEAAQQIHGVVILLTLRADFMGQVLNHRAFADALQDNDIKLGPMNVKEIVRAIEQPALVRNVKFEEGLIKRILGGVVGQPGTLPLLEFALTQLWDQQEHGILTHKAFDAIGEVKGAVAQHAENVYAKLRQEEQEQAHSVFIQLVNPGSGTEDTRRLATKDELGEDSWELVMKLADARLVVTSRTPDGQQVAEIVHETLIRDWDRLRDWMAEDREFRFWQEHLRNDLNFWKANSMKDSGLLIGGKLVIAKNWLRERSSDLTDEEKQYIQKSATQDKRKHMVRQIGYFSIVAFIAFIAVFGWIIYWRATVAENAAKAGFLAAQGQVELENDPLLGLRLSIEGYELIQNVEAETAHINKAIRNISRYGRIAKFGNDIQNIFVSPDESLIVIDRATKPGMMQYILDTGHVITNTLTFEVKDITFGSGSGLGYFVVEYSKKYDPELRRTDDGEVVLKSSDSGSIENIYLSPGISTEYYIVDYRDRPGELISVSDAEVAFTLSDEIDQVTFSQDPFASYLWVEYESASSTPNELLRFNNENYSIIATRVEDVIFSRNANCPYFVIQLSNLATQTLYHQEDGPVLGNFPSGTVEEIYCSPELTNSYVVLDYANDQEGILINVSTDNRSITLNNVVETVRFSSNPDARFFWVKYENSLGELRDIRNGEIAYSDIEAVHFPQEPSASYFIVTVQDKLSEVWSVSDNNLNRLSLSGIVQSAYFYSHISPNMVIIDYLNNRGEIRKLPDGEILQLDNEIGAVYTKPDGIYTLIDYVSGAGEVRRNKDLKSIETDPALKPLEDVVIETTSMANYYKVHYTSRLTEIWEGEDDFVRLLELDRIIKKHILLKSSDTVIIIYTNNEAYLLDLKWLKDIAGKSQTMPLNELIRIACEGPLGRGMLDVSQLDDYLDGREPKGCQSVLTR